MNIEIRKLTPELAEDYVRFFDVTPHDDNVNEHKCYCVCWCNDDYEGKDLSTAEKRRKCAFQYVRNNKVTGVQTCALPISGVMLIQNQIV